VAAGAAARSEFPAFLRRGREPDGVRPAIAGNVCRRPSAIISGALHHAESGDDGRDLHGDRAGDGRANDRYDERQREDVDHTTLLPVSGIYRRLSGARGLKNFPTTLIQDVTIL